MSFQKARRAKVFHGRVFRVWGSGSSGTNVRYFKCLRCFRGVRV